MAEFLTTGCLLSCNCGLTPSVFVALELPGKPVITGMAAATIMEIIPFDNVLPFGMCKSLANPQVASATAAAQGSLTPMPCVPVIPAPWEPPSVITSYAGLPMATVQSKCMCAWAGEISVEQAAETIATTD
ncbi:DUF4280 domain-containing protein [Inquilinus sp. CA228]|uniref:DUF4280 domain-containing protein n=1 Tax=Inquilinus sp. CA228 TaxID=3455609 RepID=UPI003F8D7EE4